MAITLTKQPAEVVPTHDFVDWGMTMDDIGDDVIIKKIGYQLVYENGDEITPLESFRPLVAGDEFITDFQDDIKSLVVTMIPLIDIPAVANDTMIHRKIKLKFGEIITDTSTFPCTTTTNITQESPLITIVNSCIQVYENGFITDGSFAGPIPLTHQPHNIWQHRESRNWLWLLGSASGVLTTSDGQSASLIPAFFCNYIPLHPHGLELDNVDTLDWIQYNYSAPGGSGSYRINFRDDCKNGLEFKNIMFLDPKGGRCCMSFELVQDFTVDTSQQLIQTFVPMYPESSSSNDNVTRQNIGDVTVTNKQVRDRITLVRDAPNNKEHREWFKAFLASSGYHIQFKNNNGQLIFQKFIIESGSIVYNRPDEEVDFVISGFLVPQYITHRIDR